MRMNTSGFSRSTLNRLGTESATASIKLCRVKVLWFLILNSILYYSLRGQQIIQMRRRHFSGPRPYGALTLNMTSSPRSEINSSIVFRVRFLISGIAVIQELDTGVSLEIYLLVLQCQGESQRTTTCLVCVMPFSRILSRYFSTSVTGSTGGLHEINITVKGLD